VLPVKETTGAGGKTIVLVDDSVEMNRCYQQLLEMEGYQVFTADSGPEALELLKRIPSPDLMLVDCLMPGMSGIDFLNELKTVNPNFFQTTPIVGLSGMFAESALLTEMRSLVSHLAEKPNDIDEVVKLVRENVRR